MAFWNIQHILNKIFDSATSALNIKVTGSLPAFAAIPAVSIDQTTPGTTNLVDTELPAAAALADAAANPTTPTVGAALKVWNGTTWDNADGVNTGQLVVTQKSSAGTEPTISTGAIGGDASSPVAAVYTSAHPMGLNSGGTWDRWRNNTEATAISSAARTATAESAVLTNYNGRGIQVAVHASAKAVATTLTVNLRVRDSVSDVYTTKASSTAFAAVAATTYVVDFAPGVLDADYGATGDGRNVLVPRTYKIEVVPGDANSVTYGASVSTI